ncbi:ribonuclease H-like domain-containing protein [Tanacetum coccineum]|uniref:Ribonuclease H-like domain-containing protein n=1 Tax=Tanacetum coccineum TaxID=301880 RepID=A0ABQ5C7K5_9ASTR
MINLATTYKRGLIVKLNQTEFKATTYKRGLTTVEEQLVTYRKNEVLFSEEVVVLKREVACKDYEISVLKNEFEKVKQEKEGIEFKIKKFDNASKSLDKLLGSQITDKGKKGLGYNDVPPPHHLIYNAPTKLDLSYSSLNEFKEPEFKSYDPRDSNLESNIDKKSDNSKENTDDSLVKEQVSENENSSIVSPLNVDKETVFPADKKIEFVKPKNNEKPVRKSVKYAEMYRSQSPRGNQRNWNGQKSNQLGSDFVMYNKACFVCGSFDHVQINCHHHQRKRMVSGNNYNRVDYDYYAKTSHPSAHRNMVPRAVLLKSGLTPLNTARPVYTAQPKPTVHSARSMSHFSKQAQSTDQRPFYKKTTLTNRYFHQKVNTVMGHCYTVRPKVVNTARPYTTLVNAVRAKRGKPQMDDKGFVDSGCSRHMTGNIAYLSDFKEFDGGYVTFGGGTHGGRISGKGTLKTDCLDFEDLYFVNELKFNLFSFPDESQILLKILRKDNMYSFDIKNIVPKENLTCLVAKATLDESMLWHRRLGHINFKNINKLVKENLVRGLPLKHFENDQTCVACLKGKQHRASCKSKVLNPITKPLFMLHMDLFGPTFVSSLMHKKYCLVVTDDYSREKGIRREYSVARTPQQNGVAERRNRTLIEAARTMLADSKLPTTFWAEAVSTACYVQNRVLVVKPHNKTPYEVFIGFKPALSFMRPFGCHVTILNTLDNLCKFDGKSDEGFFVGYSLSSKAFRVYNTRTRKVEENLHIGFLENKPMIEGNGPKWLFDIDSLTQSMNYVPVAAGTITNESTDASYFDSLSKDVGNDEPKYVANNIRQVKDGPHNESGDNDKSEDDSSPKEDNVAGQHINTASLEVNTDCFEFNTVDPLVNTASSYDPHSLKDMFKVGASHTLEATHVEFFSNEDEPEVNLGNIPNSYTVPTTPNTRIHKDHPIKNVIGDVKSSIQTRRMRRSTSAQGFLSAVYEEKIHDTLNTCLYTCFLSQIEPTGIAKALSDSSNKKDERGIVIRNKARLVAQGHRQEECIDYEEVFARVARIEAIRLFLAYASFMGFLVYQIDVKSAFLYGTIEEEVYATQPPGFKDPDHPDKVYKVVKALYGLHQAPRVWLQVKKKEDGIFISQDKYVAEILKKFNYTDVKSVSTPVDLENPLVKDGDADDFDVHLYRSMIGSLMYLTASRPDIMFAVCACARFQVTPKTSHLLAIKRIFRYLKGKLTLGLWYSRDSPFELVAYTDSEYA